MYGTSQAAREDVRDDNDEADADDIERAESGGAPDALLDADIGGVSPVLFDRWASTVAVDIVVCTRGGIAV